jgi:hypothetical protein
MRIACALLLALAPGVARAQQDHTNLDESRVGSYSLPPLLVGRDGAEVKTARQWSARRRPEILKLYQDEVYGHTPEAPPPGLSTTVVERSDGALGGLARRKQIEIRLGTRPDAPVLHVLVYTPMKTRKPVPLFMVLHFNGNWAITDDPGVNLYPIWDRKTRQRAKPGVETPRGSSKEWDVPLVLSRGYGIAALYYGDVEPDFDGGAGLPFGVRALYLPPGRTTRADDDWGAIGAWAWGMSRALDYLRTDRDVDGKRVVAVGQSRLGKTVLWAGSRDQRFAMVIASCSGEGGAALSRRDYGENLDNMTSRYLYQFAERFKRFNKHWNDLPVDAHMLVALMAPRPLLLNTGSEDRWSDPRGEFLAAQAATPAYQLFGERGPAGEEQPPLDTPLFNDLAFHEHTGRHAILASDWKVFLDFADRYLRPH